MILELDAATAKHLKQLEIDCSKSTGRAELFSINLPVILVTSTIDQDCYMRGVRSLLGDGIVERLLEVKWRFETRVVQEATVLQIELRND